eukprot:440031-Lingulodinium_polyedra.AAC.1
MDGWPYPSHQGSGFPGMTGSTRGQAGGRGHCLPGTATPPGTPHHRPRARRGGTRGGAHGGAGAVPVGLPPAGPPGG